MEHQRTIEEDMNRERNGIIQALMKRAAGGAISPTSCFHTLSESLDAKFSGLLPWS